MGLRDRFLRRPSRETVAWTFVIIVLLAAQWPMLKGRYYQWIGATPPASAITWYTDADAALAEAKRTGRPVLVDFAADWCPPCVTMKHDVWPDPRVVAAVRDGYVPLLVDIDAQPALAERYQVSGIPTVKVLDENGVVIREATFLGASGMARFLTEGA
jgi:thiol:disulfide interchange protein